MLRGILGLYPQKAAQPNQRLLFLVKLRDLVYHDEKISHFYYIRTTNIKLNAKNDKKSSEKM